MSGSGRRFRRLSWSVWLVTLAIVLFLGSLIAHFSYRQFLDQTESRLILLLQEMTIAMDAQFNGHIAIARVAVAHNGPVSCYELSGLNCRAETIPQDADASDATAGGVLSACPFPQWREHAYGGGIALGPVVGENGAQRAALVARTGDWDGGRIGALCIDVARILTWWRSIDWPAGTQVSLMRGSGDVWMQLRAGAAAGAELPLIVGPASESAGIAVFGQAGDDLDARTVAWHRSQVLDLTVAAGFTADSGFTAWAALSRPLLAAIGLSALVFPLALALVYGRLISTNRENRRHAQRMNLAVESGEIGIWEYEPSTGFLDWNEQMFRIFGVKRDSFGGHLDDWRATCLAEDLAPTERALEDCIETGTRFQRLFRINRGTDGALRWIQAYAEPSRDETGTVTAIIGLNWDVTKDIENKAELGRRLAEAKDANAAKDRFLATLSHELRTPLNAIIGFTDLMRSNVVRITHEKRDQYLADVHHSAQHLLSLINDMLDLARINNDALDLAKGPVDLGDAIETLPSLTGARGAGAGPRLVWDIPEPAPIVLGDVRAVQQILINIVGNALKFTAPEGKVTVETGRRTGGMIEIVVIDTGIGIPADRLPLLGEPFAKGESVYQANDEGVGLGLAITKRLAEAMGGRFAVESTLGLGTRVAVTLPGIATPEPTTAD